MGKNLQEINPVPEPGAQVIAEKPYKIGSSARWDRKITEKQFYEEVLLFDNCEIDMYEVVPMRVNIRPGN